MSVCIYRIKSSIVLWNKILIPRDKASIDDKSARTIVDIITTLRAQKAVDVYTAYMANILTCILEARSCL